MADDIDDVRERLARNLVEQKPVLDLLAKSDSTDACARCSHPRGLHVTSCRQSWQESDSETGPAGTYVCGCEGFVEPTTPDQAASRLAMQGVAVWRSPRLAEHGASEHYYTDFSAYLVGDREPGRWHTEAVASALVDVAEAARAVTDAICAKVSDPTGEDATEQFGQALARLLDAHVALTRLDAAKAASSSAEGPSS